MFEDLNWKSAAGRSAVVIAIYLGLLYLLSVAFPGSSFNLDSRAQVISLFVNAIIFFFIFTFVYAFVDRSWRRRKAARQKDGELDFVEADRRYAELKQQYDAGTIDDEEFDTQRRQLMVQDSQGRWWAKGREDDKWYYRSESGWLQGTPPDYSPKG
jgi:uncharacterized membrane protein